MRIFSREAWAYAVLLILLCAIAAIAVWQTISYLADRVPPDEFRIIAAAIWALSMGFMLIAGAFGLWATQFAAQAEGRRRVAGIVDAMDYLADGLVAVDGRGRITGANPSARGMAGSAKGRPALLRGAFPCLSPEDQSSLLGGTDPREVERDVAAEGGTRTLRFRSQPAEGLTLVFISDVTAMQEDRRRQRRAAQLQLIGQLAKGVAHDLNGLLCSVSGYASLAERLARTSPEAAEPLRAIGALAGKGVVMAGHLLELAHAEPDRPTAEAPWLHVRRASDMLRGVLPGRWSVEVNTEVTPPVTIPGPQLEQVVLNLGLMAADEIGEAGRLTVTHAAAPADAAAAPRAHRTPAALITLAAAAPAHPDPVRAEGASLPQTPVEDAGVILSVIRTVVGEAGGSLSLIGDAGDRITIQLTLPCEAGGARAEPSASLPDELGAYIARWHVLLAAEGRAGELLARMRRFGVVPEQAADAISLVAAAERTRSIDAIVVDERVLRQEPVALLKTILKLQPTAGIVVLCSDPDVLTAELGRDVVFVARQAPADAVLLSMIESRSLAVRRHPS